MLNSAPKAPSSVTVPPPSFGAVRDSAVALGIGAHLHYAALGAGHRAPDEQQVLLGDHVNDRQALLSDPGRAHVTRATDALHHARRPGGCADRARCAVVVRAVGLGTAREVMALDGALEALALGGAGDLDLVAGGEGLDGDGVTELQIAGLVAELDEVAQ